VLLQPERINAYAQAVIRTLRALTLLAGPGVVWELAFGSSRRSDSQHVRRA
jgi:hypothetical protein